jgi:hypothetical protein
MPIQIEGPDSVKYLPQFNHVLHELRMLFALPVIRLQQAMTTPSRKIGFNRLNRPQQLLFGYLQQTVFHILLRTNPYPELVDQVSVVVPDYPLKIREGNVLLHGKGANHPQQFLEIE